ncbi:Hypp3964 [Branchiostoma lanceolatum]|uniref:Hypp3964 protein n=1 Tax=Branchiostoma lanceolatum TaxID=7740 RepID=A0A8K0ESI3_BRALA|nr:Hypp3964 [Branchiostoma lanceolatum]
MAKRNRNGLDEDVVTMSTVRELLENQKKEFTGLMELQERNFKSFIETFTVTTNRRLDDLIREVQDVKGSLQYSKKEIGGAKIAFQEQEERITGIESKISQLRSNKDESSHMLRLFVRGLDGKTTTVRICKDATVDQLYRRVRHAQGNELPLNRMRILHKTWQLSYGCDRYLSDYDVENESTIFVHPVLVGD